MKRREFITLESGAVTSRLLIAYSQQTAVPVVGYLNSRSPGDSEAVVEAFREGLSEVGFIVGQNPRIECRWAEGHYDRLPAFAAEIVGLRVTAILAEVTLRRHWPQSCSHRNLVSRLSR
jgi:putative ABC transport system substrate-binding protein